MGFHLGAENVHADHRRKQYRHHPRHQHRTGNHRKQGVGVFTGRAGVQADRHEARHRHQRTGEHRERRGGVGEGRRLLLGLAQLQTRNHHFHGDHRIVHQQAEGDDQCTEGNPLHGDAAVFHEYEHHRQHQRDRARHHQPGTHAKADEADQQYDHHGLEQRAGKAANGLLHHHGLVGDVVNADTDRQVGGQLVDTGVQGLAERLDVATLLHGNRQADGRFAVEAEFRRGRIDVAAADFGNIGQAIVAVVELEVDLGQVFLRSELP
ncbi:hypothetical protein D3C73_578510 [compost metagenome]